MSTRSSRCRAITRCGSFPNVILTPHTAGYSPVIAGRHLASLVENVRRFARGEPLLNVVDKALVVLSGCARAWMRTWEAARCRRCLVREERIRIGLYPLSLIT